MFFKNRLSLFGMLVAICLWCATSAMANVSEETFISPESSEIIIDLNGTWDFTPDGLPTTYMKVPGFYVCGQTVGRFTFNTPSPNDTWKFFEGKRGGVYQRKFNISSDMNGKQIIIHFESVNFGCRIKINNQFVTFHYGGFLPFDVDITGFINIPSQDNILTVEIIDNNPLLFLNYSENDPLWPIGFYGHKWDNGITGPVSLIARPQLHISNIFAHGTVSNNTLYTEITIVNTSSQTMSGNCICEIVSPALRVGTQNINIDPGESLTLEFNFPWSDVTWWSPENPHLYEMTARIEANGLNLCQKNITFGFKEFRIIGTHYYLNGTRLNLRGDSIVLSGEKRYWPYLVPDRTNWPAIIDSLFTLNINVIRLHQEPFPTWMIDVCDEKGMLVISESAIYGKVANKNAVFIANACKWQKEWIRRDRNHPSIILWSASNEMLWPSKYFEAAQIAEFGKAITEMDTTRPILYDGDFDLEGLADVYSRHYILGFPVGFFSGSGIYRINRYRHATKPSAHSEFDWSRGTIPESQRIRIQCLKARAMRVGEWADIRPYRLDWAWHPNQDFFSVDYGGWHPEISEIEFLKDTFNPVAAFDTTYYEFNLFPSRPAYDEGSLITRQIVIFNDKESDPAVEVRWEVILKGTIRESGKMPVQIGPGEKLYREINFNAPIVTQDSDFELKLSTFKQDIEQFSEIYAYHSRENGVAIPGKPRAPADLQISVTNGLTTLSWSPVVRDENGLEITTASYRCYRSRFPTFKPASTDSFTITNNNFSETKIPSDSLVFYRIVCIGTSGKRSDPTDTAGRITYPLRITNSTDFNSMAIPFAATGITTASSLLQRLPLTDATARWSAIYQGYFQYLPPIPKSNFDLENGSPLLINVTADTSCTICGILQFFNYNLIHTAGSTNFNFITLPTDKYAIDSASLLLANIPNCNSVAYWNSSSQSYNQYLPGNSNTDFAVQAGYPYLVNVTANATWPTNNVSKIIEQSKGSTSNTFNGKVPHLIIIKPGENTSSSAIATITGYINTSASPVSCNNISHSSSENMGFIQCAEFEDGWAAGDLVFLFAKDLNGQQIAIGQCSLSNNPGDELILFPYNHIEDRITEFNLQQNYPNPFNPATTIHYSLPEPSKMQISIFDLKGRLVIQLINKLKPAGLHSIIWDGYNKTGQDCPSGIYICQLKTAKFHKNIRMIRLK